MDTKSVWLVTGASKGLGLSLVKKLLDQGYRVIATSRNVRQLIQELGNESAVFLPLELDLTNNEKVKNAIARGISHFGAIDVVVNNAGYGQIGTLEELTDEEVRKNFDVNVFGSLNVIRGVMPYLRQQRSGHIFNIASIGGYYAGFAGWGIYCATKFAVAGFTESLAEEIKQFGLNATVVYPGYFRTAFLSEGSIMFAKNPILAYEEARKSERMHLNEINGNQPNDPEKAADALIAISKEKNPPVHLFLGSDAYDMAHKKISVVSNEIEQWKAHTIATAF